MAKQIVLIVFMGFVFLALVTVVVSLTYDSSEETTNYSNNGINQNRTVPQIESLGHESMEETARIPAKDRVLRDCVTEDIPSIERKVSEALEMQVSKVIDTYNNGTDYFPGFMNITQKYSSCAPPSDKPLKMNEIVRLFIATTVKKAMVEYKM